MELLIITAVQAFEKDIKQLLKKSGVMASSHMEVNGYKEPQDTLQDANWFASSIGEYQSVLFYAFAKHTEVSKVIEAIEGWNNNERSQSSIHFAVLDIQKHNEFKTI